ncbi:bacitracin synthetase 3, partial [Paenibacillus alvei TS-15]
MAGVEYVAPRTELENRLAGIWQSVLGVEKVGVKDNFFDLGGHSLKATMLMARMHKELNVNVPLRIIFQAPTLEQLAQAVAGMEQQLYASIEPVEARAYYPLSSAQKRMYILNQLRGASLGYNMPGVYAVEGPLATERLEQAFRALIARHESLRTSFEMVDGEPVQRVHDQVPFVVERKRLTQVESRLFKAETSQGAGEPSEAERIADMAKQVESFVRPFDLEQAPLLRVGLIEVEENHHLLLFDMHHIISDGVSMNVLVQEFARLYEGDSLPELRIQYKDYAAWQQSLAQSETMQKQEAFWMETFTGDIPVLELPTDYARPAVQSFEGDDITFDVSSEVTASLQRIAAETGATMYMVLLAAYTALLSKYTRQEDIVVGTPIAGRPHADLEPLIGMFVGTLAMRNYPEGERTFTEFVSDVKERALKAFENQDYPFEELVEKLDVRKDLSRNPLFDAMFVMQNTETTDVRLGDLEFAPYGTEHKAAKFDLTLHAVETDGDGGLIFTLQYRTALFRKETMERMANHFICLLQSVADQPEQRLSKLSILPEPERQCLIYGFNDTEAAYPEAKTIHGLFEEQVEKTPERVAVVFGEERLTYRELNERAEQLARALRQQGVQPDALVGLLTERSLDMIVGILGILKAGGAYVPLDPDYPEERIRYMLEDCGAKLLVTQKKLAELAGMFTGTILEDELVDELCVVATKVKKKAGAEANLGTVATSSWHGNEERNVRADHLAYVIYTSGTTGKPKGVLIEHRQVVRLLFTDRSRFDFGDTDVWTLFHSYCFDFSVWEMYGALLYGGRLVIIPKQTAQDPAAYLQVLKQEQVTIVNQTPTAFYHLADEELRCTDKRLSVRKVIFGGEALEPLQLKRFREKYPETQLINMYGITETTVHVTYKELTEDDLGLSKSNIGSPIPTLTAYVLDAARQPVPIGIPGELYVGGAGVARGYLNRSELTTERFVDHPFIAGERVYRTGDLARWLPDGNLEYLGRIDHQVKIRGYRIELGEIETQLLRHEQVKETIVLARKSAAGDPHLCAYVVVTGEHGELDVAELRRYLGQHLPSYMIPSFFVALERMPLTSNGKIDRQALPSPEGQAVTGVEYVAPRTEQEAQLAEVWQRVLGLDRVGAKDNFFDLGGHSLKATTLVAQMHKELSVNVPLRFVFQFPTLEQMAQEIAGMEQQLYAAIEPVEARAYYPLSSAQKRMYILNQLEGAALGYNMPGAYTIEGVLDANRLEQAFCGLIARHESLRTSFAMVDGEPVQRVHEQLPFTIEVERL